MMAASNLNLGKASGGVLNIQPADGTTTTNLVLPAINGTVVAADSNGNVGIGTSSPSAKLDVQGNLRVYRNGDVNRDTYVGIEVTDVTTTFNGYDPDGYMTYNFNSNGSTKMRLDYAGNMGIGVAPSAWSNYKGIQIGSYADSILGFQAGGGEIDIIHNAITTDNGGTWTRATANACTRYKGDGLGVHTWQTAPSGTAGGAVTWTTAMILDANGNLLPNNVILPYSSSDAYGCKQANNNGLWYGRVVPFSSDGTMLFEIQYAGNGGGFRFNIDGVQKLKVDTSGNLIVNPSAAAVSSYVICYTTNSTNYTYMQAQSAADTNLVFNSRIGGVTKSAILANGSFQSATNSYGSTSDAKLKENIVDTSPKLEKLMKVKVRNFNYIGQEDSKQIGVVAQEIEQIFPGVVYVTKDTKQVEVEKEREKTLEDGTVEIEKYTETEMVETGETTKNVKYSVIYMMMLKAMQEMREEYTTQIDELKARIAILEGGNK